MRDTRIKIKCGKCGHRHSSVDGVRKCHQGIEIWQCQWLVSFGWHEDYEVILPCEADSWLIFNEDGSERGYECAAGHDHVYCEARHAEGWDYAADELEAEGLRRNGIDAVSMRGDSI